MKMDLSRSSNIPTINLISDDEEEDEIGISRSAILQSATAMINNGQFGTIFNGNIAHTDGPNYENINSRKRPRINLSKTVLLPQQVIGLPKNSLTTYEFIEILSYPIVYYFGRGAIKVKNFLHYDDEDGFYNYCLRDHISYRYEIIELLDTGTFGQVFKVFDHKHKMFAAIKVIRSSTVYGFQTLQEIEILKYIKARDKRNSMNIICMFDHFKFRGHICISFELLHISLQRAMEDMYPDGFPSHILKVIARSILKCLKSLKRLHIIHGDLKPDNIVLQRPDSWEVKVIDFGGSCHEFGPHYWYIQSRYYRAPEVLMVSNYGSPIDMWSFGCVMGELSQGFPIFCGANEMDQMAIIIEVLGLPPKQMIRLGNRGSRFFDLNEKVLGLREHPNLLQRGPPSTKPLEFLFEPSVNNTWFIDFLKRCLEYNPNKRMTPFQALRHIWLTNDTDV